MSRVWGVGRKSKINSLIEREIPIPAAFSNPEGLRFINWTPDLKNILFLTWKNGDTFDTGRHDPDSQGSTLAVEAIQVF